jgi:ABC-type bacteriocin/lantibiotic exporter with double-glycine peptidase domain
MTKKYAYINDPADGAKRIPIDEFDKAFTGVFIVFEKTAEFQPGGKPKSVLEFAKKRLKGTLVPFIFVIITGLLTAFIGIINPVLSRVFIDRVLTGINSEWLYPLIFGMASMAVISIIVSLINAIYLYKIKGKLAIVANSSFLWHVLRLPMDFFSQRMAGEIAQRQDTNETIAETLISKLAPLALNIIMMVFYLVIMLRYNLLLTFIGIGAISINVFLAAVISKKRISIARVQMRGSGKVAAATVGGIDMIETIKSAGAENGFFENWSGIQASLNNARARFVKVNSYLGSLPEALNTIASIIILVTGVYLIMNDDFTIGMLLAFQGFLSSLTKPVAELIDSGQTISEMRVLMERVEDVFNYPADVAEEPRNKEPNLWLFPTCPAID